uniref:NAD(+) ADP-ribosyltransferase n=1 Tax=Parastrongyloides trichosuri TaxID=131310 RepID=A0A0N4ZE08_PARTI
MSSTGYSTRSKAKKIASDMSTSENADENMDVDVKQEATSTGEKENNKKGNGKKNGKTTNRKGRSKKDESLKIEDADPSSITDQVKEEEKDEEKEPTPEVKTKTVTKKVGRRGKKKNDNNDIESKINEKKPKLEEEVKKKVRMPLDSYLDLPGAWEVCEDDKMGPYSVTLNQTNVTANNNKFFVLQVISNASTNEYMTYIRWGRVGFKGQIIFEHGNKERVIEAFCKKFKDKTGHTYIGSNIEYVKKPGKYFPIEMKGEEVKSEDEANEEEKKIPDSKLEANVKRVMEIICSLKLMNQTLKSLNIDLDKMPLGKLSKKQITIGYECLKEIEKSIDSKDKDFNC